MNVVVLNGSPKGELGVTLQSVKFMDKMNAPHRFEYCHISQSIAAMEKQGGRFSGVIDRIAGADLVIWCTPVYVCLVPSQLTRFLELVWERGAAGAFKDKSFAVVTTSIHFFDHTAHRYLNGICHDFGMRPAGNFSADSYDFLKPEGRTQLLQFSRSVFRAVSEDAPCAGWCGPVPESGFRYVPGPAPPPLSVDGRMVVVTDGLDRSGNIAAMIRRFRSCFSSDITLVDLEKEGGMKGGCLGCVQCGFDHECVYKDKDGFIELYDSRIRPADILVFAGTIRNRFLSSLFKRFFDRSFFNTHTPGFVGKQMGFLISGPLAATPHLRDFLEIYAQWQGANLVDVVTDEAGDASVLDHALDSFARRTREFHREGYVQPPTFLGVGGMKVFRDDIWGRHRFVFQADHTWYLENGLYDFPQDDKRITETNAFMYEMTAGEPGRTEIRKSLAKEMVRPHLKKLAQCDPESAGDIR